MEEKDRLLLTCLQKGLPLTPRPFDVWAARLGTDSADLLVRIQRLKKEGSFGGIKAILDPRAFHYQSTWVAMRIGQERHAPAEAVLKHGPSVKSHSVELGSLAEALWQHPGVIYVCEREHEFNVWFFFAAPAGYDLELHVRCLGKLAGAQSALFLPVCQVFKRTNLLSSLDAETFSAMNERLEKQKKACLSELTVRIGQERHLSPNAASAGCENFEISNRSQVPAEAVLKEGPSEEEIGLIRELQEPFPLTDEPYQKMAADLGITEAQVLERMKSLVKKGYLKRIGIFLKPPASLPEARTWVVWHIPEEKLERIGTEIAEFREVLYADRRPAYPEFPYSLYTMIRAETAVELEVVTRHMQDRIGKWPHQVLVTTRELKKAEMKYFPKELEGWWRASRHVAETAFN